MSQTPFRTFVVAVLLGAALLGYLRAARAVGERWAVRGAWWSLGIVSMAAAVVFVLMAFREYAGALVLAAVAVGAIWLPGALRRRTRSDRP